MAVKRRTRLNRAYGLDNALQELNPTQIVALRAPTSADIAAIGTQWTNKSSGGSIYVLQRVANGLATWSTSPASGATTLSSLTVTTTADIGTDMTVGGTLDVTGVTTLGDLSVSGAFNLGAATGQIDFTTSANQADAILLEATAGGIDILASGASAGEDIDIVATGSSVNLRSTENAANAIFIEADGGTSETIYVHSDQGTGAASIHLESDVGGVTLTSGLASADAINLSASAGGVDIDGALQVNIASSQNAVDAIRIVSSAGGIDIDAVGAATEDINITNTGGSIVLSATESAADSVVIQSTAGGIDILASGAAAGEDIDIVATGSSVNISSSESAADAITINASAGGIDITNTGTAGEDIDIASSGASVNISSTENAASAITLVTNGGVSETLVLTNTQGTGAASIDLNAVAGGVTVDAAGGISLDGATASNFTVTGAGQDLTLASSGGSVSILATEDAASAVLITTNGGTSETLALNAAQGTGANSINLVSDAGGITLTSNLATADGINLNAVGGGLDLDGALQVNIASSQAAVADSIRIVASAADGGMDLDSGTGGTTIDSTGAVSIDGAAASNFSVSGAGNDLTFDSAGGRVVLDGGEAAANAITIGATDAAGGIDVNAGTGGITVDSGAAISLDSAAASNFTITGAGDLTLAAGTSSVNVTGAEADAAAVLVSATNASGGITLDAGVTPGVTFTNGTQSFQMLVGTGSPNGSVTASQGSMYVDIGGSTSTTILFVNTDGSTTWVGVGA